jgi:predicted nucleic acid-binding protein
MNVVIDASSLIVLARVEALGTLHQIYNTTALPPAVFEEVVVAGEQLGKNDAWVVKAAMDKGWVVPITLAPEEEQIVKSLRQQYRALGLGECQALACAEKRHWLLLVEERKARVVARARGIRYSIIQVLPLQGYLDGKLPEGICLDLMDKIAGEMGADLAVLHALKAAISALAKERKR